MNKRDMKNTKTIQTSNFSKSILDKIEKDAIAITPKWHFVLRESLFWILLILAIGVGAISVSVIMLHLLQIDLAIAVRASGGMVNHIARFAPYVWITLLSLVTLASWYNFNHTKKGYQYSYIFVVLGSVITSIFIGTILYFGGAAEHAENYAIKMSGGYYQGRILHREQMWSQPEKGLLAGMPIENSNRFSLRDFTGKIWSIDVDMLTETEKAVLLIAPKIAMIGIQKEPTVFIPCRIIPWEPSGGKAEMKKKIQSFLPDGTMVSERSIFQLYSNICDNKE